MAYGGGNRIIRASELGEYMFCSQSWHMHQVKDFKMSSSNRNLMDTGILKHQEHAQSVQKIEPYKKVSNMFMVGFLITLIIFLAKVFMI